LPWRIPEDLKRFKRLTMDKPLLMGRRTYESIGRPLPGRRMVVLTRTGASFGAEVLVAASLTDALSLVTDAEEVMVAGGAEVYAAALPLARKMHLTRVHDEVAGDAMFPPYDPTRWRRVCAREHPADDRHAHRFTFEDYERA